MHQSSSFPSPLPTTWKPYVACALAKCALAQLPDADGETHLPAEPTLLFGQALKEVVMRRHMTATGSMREAFYYVQLCLEQTDRMGASLFVTQVRALAEQAFATTSFRKKCDDVFGAVGGTRARLEQLYQGLRTMSADAGAFADEVHDLYVASWAKEVGGAVHRRTSVTALHTLVPSSK